MYFVQNIKNYFKKFIHSTGSTAVTKHFGPGTGPIHMDEVRCNGSEPRVSDCQHEDTHNCGHKEDIGVICREGVFFNRETNKCSPQKI